jgi:alkanesulfonate monooxygenase SsuD/methylene tetrahydromethanopterin reductase-like flavin-dependent oxidoreductase (luciferase family)
MRIGIGLPAAIPGAAPRAIVEWAAMAEATGFESVGVIDRLVYDNIDPLVALAAAAAQTERIELLTTVLNVPWRRNGVALAKQLASLDRISGGRLTAGLGLGGWPDDHAVVGPAPAAGGALMDEMLAAMRAVWAGDVGDGNAAIPALAPGRPGLLIGGLVPAAYRRAARVGDGWVAPSFGYEALTTGIRGVQDAWRAEGRTGRPRVVVERYFSLGADADETAERYLHHYYGDAYVAAVVADTITSVDRLERELARLAEAGCDDLVLLPCDAGIRQVELLAGALDGLRARA